MVDYPNIFGQGMAAFDAQTKRLNAFADDRASKEAGAAIASGDYAGGANAFNRAGMVEQAHNVLADQTALEDRKTRAADVATDRATRAQQQRLDGLLKVTDALTAVPEGQRIPWIQQHATDLATMGLPMQAFAGKTEADLSNAAIEPFRAALGKQKQDFTLAAGQVRYDGQGREIAKGPAKPQEYLVLPEGGKAIPKPTDGATVDNVPQQAAAPAGGDPGAAIDAYAKGGGATVTSGLRTPEHNAEVGGVPNSRHLTGQARDLVPPPGATVAQLAAEMQRRLPGAKVIQESDHVHVQWDGPQAAPAAVHVGDPAGTLYGNPKERPAPSGYRWTGNGSLEAIPGGPAETGEEKHLSPDAIALVGAQYLRMGPDAMKNMGQGKAGVENKNRVMEWVAKTAKEAGTSNPDLVARFAQSKANQAALTQNTKMLAAISASEHTLDANLDYAMTFAKKGVGPTGLPLMDTPINKLRTALGSEDSKNLDNLLTTTGNEYAKILSSATGTGGATSDSARAEAQKLIHPGMTLRQITSAVNIAKKEAENRRLSYAGESSRLVGEISGGQAQSPPPPPVAPAAAQGGWGKVTVVRR